MPLPIKLDGYSTVLLNYITCKTFLQKQSHCKKYRFLRHFMRVGNDSESLFSECNKRAHVLLVREYLGGIRHLDKNSG